jgi:hypothetical protein
MLRRKIRLISVGIFIFLLILVISEGYPQVPDDIKTNLLIAYTLDHKWRNLLAFSKDLDEYSIALMTKSQIKSQMESFVSSNLANYADIISEVANSSSTYLYIYCGITSEPDRRLVASLIKPKLNLYLIRLNSRIEQINKICLPSAKLPATVAFSNRLKDEIREIKELFGSIKLP